MERTPMARRRCCIAERERDIAIDEAAAAYYELELLRDEVAVLRREKEAWEAGKDAWSQRHEHLLWHVGNMAEVLWHAMRQGDEEYGGTAARTMGVEEARLLALQTLEELTTKSDAQLYEEMHELYAKIARMEAEQSRLVDKLCELKALNEKVVSSTIGCRVEEREAHHVHTDAGAKREQQRPAEPVLMDDVESVETSPPAGNIEREETANQTSLRESETSVVALLQAQLAMYVNYSKRHRRNGQHSQPTGHTEQ